MRPRVRWLLILFLLPLTALAHVGSPDVYYDGYAGPYHLLVTIRPPLVIPGLAEVTVRSLSHDVSSVEVVPMPLEQHGEEFAPKPQVLSVSNGDRQFFAGRLWIMLPGSWKVQVTVNGGSGRNQLAIPLPAVATTSAEMGIGMKVFLGGAGLLLILALLRIVQVANGEAELKQHETLAPARKRRAYARMGFALVIVIGNLLFGNWWWNEEAKASASTTYRTPHLQAELQRSDTLRLRLQDPGLSSSTERIQSGSKPLSQQNDLVPDHGHLLHLFLIRMPEMSTFWHLHPTQSGPGEFRVGLPNLPAGEYQVYADIVHDNGFPETEVGTITLPAVAGEPLSGDNSGGAGLNAGNHVSQLPDGYHMVWERPLEPLHAKEPIIFTFRLEDSNGAPATQMEDYMGMAGHAVFVNDDGQVFAHVHPEGSSPMAALAMVQPKSETTMDGMPGMSHIHASAQVSFPYGFPTPGDYHIFVQMKRSGQVETGVFRAHVEQ